MPPLRKTVIFRLKDQGLRRITLKDKTTDIEVFNHLHKVLGSSLDEIISIHWTTTYDIKKMITLDNKGVKGEIK